MEGFKISVIMAVYNREDLIATAVESVLRQTYSDFEIILVNDGSTDGTESKIQEYAKIHPNITAHTIVHSGVCEARNTAIGLATGDYLFFLDSDDAIHPLLFEQMIRGIRETGAAMASEYFCTLNDAGFDHLTEKFPEPKSDTEYLYRNDEETLYDLFHDSPLNMIGGLLIRKDKTDGVFFDKRFIIGEDKLYLYECVKQGADYVIIPEKWYYNRVHHGNASLDHSGTAFLSRYMRRKVFWLSELEAHRDGNADREIAEAFSLLTAYIKRHKTVKNISFASRLLRNDRKYYKRLPNKKHRIFVFLISLLNPLLWFCREAPELEIWKKSGLYKEKF